MNETNEMLSELLWDIVRSRFLGYYEIHLCEKAYYVSESATHRQKSVTYKPVTMDMLFKANKIKPLTVEEFVSMAEQFITYMPLAITSYGYKEKILAVRKPKVVVRKYKRKTEYLFRIMLYVNKRRLENETEMPEKLPQML